MPNLLALLLPAELVSSTEAIQQFTARRIVELPDQRTVELDWIGQAWFGGGHDTPRVASTMAGVACQAPGCTLPEPRAFDVSRTTRLRPPCLPLPCELGDGGDAGLTSTIAEISSAASALGPADMATAEQAKAAVEVVALLHAAQHRSLQQLATTVAAESVCLLRGERPAGHSAAGAGLVGELLAATARRLGFGAQGPIDEPSERPAPSERDWEALLAWVGERVKQHRTSDAVALPLLRLLVAELPPRAWRAPAALSVLVPAACRLVTSGRRSGEDDAVRQRTVAFGVALLHDVAAAVPLSVGRGHQMGLVALEALADASKSQDEPAGTLVLLGRTWCVVVDRLCGELPQPALHRLAQLCAHGLRLEADPHRLAGHLAVIALLCDTLGAHMAKHVIELVPMVVRRAAEAATLPLALAALQCLEAWCRAIPERLQGSADLRRALTVAAVSAAAQSTVYVLPRQLLLDARLEHWALAAAAAAKVPDGGNRPVAGAGGAGGVVVDAGAEEARLRARGLLEAAVAHEAIGRRVVALVAAMRRACGEELVAGELAAGRAGMLASDGSLATQWVGGNGILASLARQYGLPAAQP